MMQETLDTFCKVSYSIKESAQSFYDVLDQAQNMAMFSDEFTIWEQFLESIPSETLLLSYMMED